MVTFGKGVGKGGARRHRPLRNNVDGITKPAIKRLAQRAGIASLSGVVYEHTRYQMKAIMEHVLKSAVVHMEHDRRKTLMEKDIVHGIQDAYGITLAYSSGQAKPTQTKACKPSTVRRKAPLKRTKAGKLPCPKGSRRDRKTGKCVKSKKGVKKPVKRTVMRKK